MPLSQAGRSNRLGIVSCGGLRLAMSRDDSCLIGSGRRGSVGGPPNTLAIRPSCMFHVCSMRTQVVYIHAENRQHSS